MTRYAMFTDVSLDPQQKKGLGAYLFLDQENLKRKPDEIDRRAIISHINTKEFADTSSTLLEVQTVLFALKAFKDNFDSAQLTIYTDSQCISGLLGRRQRLEENNFCSKKKKKRIRNADEYQAFYNYHDQLKFRVKKVTGHTQYSSHDTVHRVFSIVDQEVRKIFRQQ